MSTARSHAENQRMATGRNTADKNRRSAAAVLQSGAGRGQLDVNETIQDVLRALHRL